MKIATGIFVLALSVGVAAGENRIPSFDEIAEFTADAVPRAPSDHFKDFKITRDDFKTVLRYQVVSREQWQNYSHVAFADRTGTITLKGGTQIRWMVKPGGLAHLRFTDGTQIFLAGDCLNAAPCAGTSPKAPR